MQPRSQNPRVKLPDGRVVQIEPDWFGKLSGFTLLFEALVLALAQQMPFAAVTRLVKESWHCVHAIRSRYVDLAVAEADLSRVVAVAVDETSCRRHDYLTIAADADERKVVFVTEGRDAATIARFAEHLAAHRARPEQITAVSIDMSPAFIRGVADHLPRAHHRRQAPCRRPRLGRPRPNQAPRTTGRCQPQRTALDIAQGPPAAVRCSPRRSGCFGQPSRYQTHRPRLALPRRLARHPRPQADQRRRRHAQVLTQWCTNVLRSKVAPMKKVARMIRRHFDGIVAWTLDPNPSDQWLHRGPQRPLPGRQTQSPRLHPLCHHAHRALPHRRQARLHPPQP
jgi:hypothetical protein